MRDATKRILIVEDDRDLLANLSEIFEDRGYFVLAARTDEAALAYVQTTRIALGIIHLRIGMRDALRVLGAFSELQSNRPWVVRAPFLEEVGRARRSYPGPIIGLVDPLDTLRLCGAVEQAVALVAPDESSRSRHPPPDDAPVERLRG